jgi:general secretion pathway protein G
MNCYPLYNRHGGHTLPFSYNLDRKIRVRGFTLIEIMIVIAIIGTLSAIATPNYLKYITKGRIALAISDIRLMEKEIMGYSIDTNELPDTLSQLPNGNITDPWGNPYRYLRINGGNLNGLGAMRRDRFMVPVNTDFDLYSMGKDGRSQTPFTAKAGLDDIVRANNGRYVGLASEY